MEKLNINSREELTSLINHNLLFPSEAASLLGVSRASFSNMVARGNFQPIKTGIGGSLFLRSEILRYKEAKAYLKGVIKSGSLQGTDVHPSQYPLLMEPAEPCTDQASKESEDS